MVKIKRNTNGDSRVAGKVPTYYEFSDANMDHIKEVNSMMNEFAKKIEESGKNHDWSKKDEPFRSTFYRDLCNTIEGRMMFEDGEWLKFHYENERHHLDKNVPDDVNLFDVLEMIADCVCAGYARSGRLRPFEISKSVIIKAFQNTVELAISMVKLEENDGKIH